MITKAVLKNFRCHKDLTMEFSQNPFYIAGRNGSGKTSAAEAVFTLLTLKSFRKINIKDAVSYGEEYLRISLSFDWEIPKELVYFYDSVRRLMTDGEETASPADFSHILPVICYSPGFETLFSNDHQERRASLDRIIYYNDKRYVEDVRRYNALLARKRAELSAERPDSDVLSALNLQLAPLSGSISQARGALIGDINIELSADPIYHEIIPELILALDVSPMLKDDKETLLREMQAKRPLCGCHKDLLYLKKGGVAVEKFQSFGQRKSALLFVLYHVSKIIEKKRNQGIILILDDFEAALDNNRINLLEGLFLSGNNGLNRQVILTGIEFPSHKGALVL
ncbi:MAG: AAA family ATPase [Deferribacteraceae bacterium]|jgi:DNA replication and repair protein RecF|nr:AAA family ATPase [Deferribacteraceae bacterium]